jgi:hypothetical protein
MQINMGGPDQLVPVLMQEGERATLPGLPLLVVLMGEPALAAI